jgi:UDP-N-acetylglucosamine 2-epimerase (non-hydrolysing)/UDP-GlcNAc3NAcA epimerase
MLAALGPLLIERRPDAVLVYGDTNSTLAGALAAAQAQIPVAHVEAGMRSFDRTMPEELNRVLTDHVSDLLLCPSSTAVENLAREGVGGRVTLVGDVMVDVALLFQPRARADDAPLEAAGVEPGGYVLVTAHRAGNVDDPERLRMLVDLLLALPAPTVLPLHPRTRARLEAAGWLAELEAAAHMRLTAPLGYLHFTALLCRARAVLTDSGGVQKEAYLAGVPCVTLRDTTEWVETVEAGWNVLVDLDAGAALQAVERTPPAERPELYGDGRAGERVVAALAALAALV